MPFTPPYPQLDERETITAAHWNETMAAITAHLNNIVGADLEAPVVLSKASQDLDGGSHYIYDFKRWFGDGSDVSVRDVTGFAATANGSDDDIEAIMDAIDDLPTTGGVIFFPPGNYAISTTIEMRGRDLKNPKSSVMLVGVGAASVITLLSDSDEAMIRMGADATDMNLANLKLDGNSANNESVPCIDAGRADGVNITNCIITDAPQDGIEIGGASNVYINNCRILDSVRFSISTDSSLGRGNGCTIQSVHFDDTNSTGGGINLAPAANNTSVIGCVFEASQKFGIRIAARDDISVTGVSIVGNEIKDAAEQGIYITTIDQGVYIRGVLVSGNRILGSGATGISISQLSGATIRGFVITENVVSGSDDAGIRVNGCKNGTIGGNICTNNGQDGATTIPYGISLGGEVDNEAEYVTIQGNGCYDDQTGSETQDYGINLSQQTQNCAIVANACNGNASGGVRNLGTDNDVGHNGGQV